MPDLSITESQQDRLEAVRREVETAYVDTYGQTRPRDAVEYLLDTYTPPEKRAVVAAYEEVATATYPTLQQVASDVDEVPGSGIEAAEMRGRLLAALGPETLAERLRAADSEADEDEVSTAGDAVSETTLDSGSPPATPDSDTAEVAGTDTASETGAGSSGENGPDVVNTAPAGPPAGEDTAETTDETPPAGAETDGESADESTGGQIDGDDSVSERQTESPSESPLASANKLLDDHSEKWRRGEGDAPYEVDLPDGTTESARTKDDVRQLLFRHY